MSNLKGSEITTAIYNTIKNAKNEQDILKMYTINEGKRYDAQNAYIKIILSVNRPDTDYYKGTFRNEYYQILIGIGSYGNNDFLNQTVKIQETITFLRQLLQTSEDMIIQIDEDNVLDLTQKIAIEDCYPSYKSNGDIINEGIMNLCFNLNEKLFLSKKQRIEKVKDIRGDIRLCQKKKRKKENPMKKLNL